MQTWSALRHRHERLFIPVLHLLPLPGAPRAELGFEAIGQRMLEEARLYVEHGAHALLLENHGDAPFFAEQNPPHVIAALAIYAARLKEEFGLPVGLNILRNDGAGAIGAAAAASADFVRINVLGGVTVTDQGLIEGRAAEWLRYRHSLGNDVAILADLDVKFGRSLLDADPGLSGRGLLQRGGADALIVSGRATGDPCDLEELGALRRAVGDGTILVGSGVRPENLGELLESADGVIVGSALKEGGYVENPLSVERLVAFRKSWESSRAKAK